MDQPNSKHEAQYSNDLDGRMWARQELDKARDDATGDYSINRWVVLFGKQFPQLGRRIELSLRIVREHARNYVRSELREVNNTLSRDQPKTLLTDVPGSSSESGPSGIVRLRLLAMFSSRFCLRISTCCSSRLRLKSSCLNPPLFL